MFKYTIEFEFEDRDGDAVKYSKEIERPTLESAAMEAEAVVYDFKNYYEKKQAEAELIIKEEDF